MDDEFERRVREEAEREAAIRRVPKKRPMNEMPESLAAIAWSDSRPRPVSSTYNSMLATMSL
jgi:hypothetical protein